jgi:hypothetical protein
MQFQASWNPVGAVWPFGIESVWLLTDGTPITQNGSVTTVAGTASLTYSTAFRQIPIVTASVVGSSSIVVTVVSVTTTGFTVDTFTSSTGVAANATISWSATGI